MAKRVDYGLRFDVVVVIGNAIRFEQTWRGVAGAMAKFEQSQITAPIYVDLSAIDCCYFDAGECQLQSASDSLTECFLVLVCVCSNRALFAAKRKFRRQKGNDFPSLNRNEPE